MRASPQEKLRSALKKDHDMADSDQRLARLEEGHYFQEKNLHELNTALLQQQSYIDALEKRLNQAEEKLRALQGHLNEGGVATLPPHSVQGLY